MDALIDFFSNTVAPVLLSFVIVMGAGFVLGGIVVGAFTRNALAGTIGGILGALVFGIALLGNYVR